MSTSQSLVFTAPHCVEIQRDDLPEPRAGQALVRSLCSAISPGTECLIYTGQFPEELAADETIASLSGKLAYPLQYGYAVVGEVIETGPGSEADWLGRRVFAFNPHQSHFVAPLDSLQPVPDDLSPEEAVFLPNMETAVNFVMDGRPLIGERVAVLGQGIVGLLTTALLGRFPLAGLITVDRYTRRRQASLEMGAHAALDPAGIVSPTPDDDLPGGADLCFELSGAPAALDLAIRLTGFDGRIIIGSWYGRKRLDLDLGGRFHRSRIRLISSQVSTLSPELTGRWSKERRFAVAWEMLSEVRPARFITHRFPLEAAAQAYQLLDEQPEQAIQVVFTYP